jgi:regulation of enolase protein 1 (concanavalin A-like superfamily)
VRQGYFSASTAELGIMCAAPEGPGFDAEFDHVSLSLAKK